MTSEDGLELTGLAVDVRNYPPLVGDTVTLSYSLTNTRMSPWSSPTRSSARAIPTMKTAIRRT